MSRAVVAGRWAVGRVGAVAGLSCGVNMETRRSILGRLLGPLCCGLLLFVLMLLDGSGERCPEGRQAGSCGEGWSGIWTVEQGVFF